MENVNILIVEDDLSFASLLQERLVLLGYSSYDIVSIDAIADAMEVKEVHGTFASRYVLKRCIIYYLLLHFKERVHFNIIREKNRYAFKAMFVPLHFVFCPSLAVSEPIF